MLDSAQHFPWPCPRPGCGGSVPLATSMCEACDGQVIFPMPGPQVDFLRCTAFMALYGGAAGGGKSYGLLLDAMNRGRMRAGWSAVIFRRHKKDLTGAGSLFEKAKRLYGPTGAVSREGNVIDVRWPLVGPDGKETLVNAPRLEFRHLDDANTKDYQGLEFAWIGFDEATHFELEWIRYLVTRCRTDSGATAVVRMTCNPDPDHQLRQWVDPYLLHEGDTAVADFSQSGRVRYWQVSKATDRIVWGDTAKECADAAGRLPNEVHSFAFIPSLLADNPALLAADPNYAAKLAAHGMTSEAQLADGDWNARVNVTGMLAALLERVVDKTLAPIVKKARGWDKAATKPWSGTPNPDFTAGALVFEDTLGNRYFAGLAAMRDGPAEVLTLQRSTSTLDGPAVTQGCFCDPGQAGKVDELTTTKNFRKSVRCGPVEFFPTGNKLHQKVINATPMAQRLGQGKLYILAGPWLEKAYVDAGEAPVTLKALLESHVAPFPTDGAKDDIVDALAAADKALDGMHVVKGDRAQTMRDANRLIQQDASRLRGRRGRGRV